MKRYIIRIIICCCQYFYYLMRTTTFELMSPDSFSASSDPRWSGIELKRTFFFHHWYLFPYHMFHHIKADEFSRKTHSRRYTQNVLPRKLTFLVCSSILTIAHKSTDIFWFDVCVCIYPLTYGPYVRPFSNLKNILVRVDRSY